MKHDLFTPLRLGRIEMPNRIVMAPMSRTRADEDGTPSAIMAEYFAQRASAGLIVTDSTRISSSARGIIRGPGLHESSHVEGWRRVAEAVHAEGGRIFVQLWHPGRVTHPDLLDGQTPVSPSSFPAKGKIFTGKGYVAFEPPRPLTIEEIRDIIDDFVAAAERAMVAGLDGVELHGAFGYLIDQFIQDGSNRRTDEFGGSVSNRIRFLLELTEAVCGSIGREKVGVKLSPSNTYYGMFDSEPLTTFGRAIEALGDLDIAYVHLMEPGSTDGGAVVREVARTFRPMLRSGTLLIANGGMTADRAHMLLQEGVADAVSFGVPFIANPDLVPRLRHGWPLAESDRSVWYAVGPKGYTDFPDYRGVEAAS